MVIPTFVQQVIGVFLRALVVFVVGWIASNGGPKFGEDQITKFVAEATPLVAVLGWLVWQKYRGRQKLLTALASPTPSSEQHVEATVATGAAPSVLTAKHETPALTTVVAK